MLFAHLDTSCPSVRHTRSSTRWSQFFFLFQIFGVINRPKNCVSACLFAYHVLCLACVVLEKPTLNEQKRVRRKGAKGQRPYAQPSFNLKPIFRIWCASATLAPLHPWRVSFGIFHLFLAPLLPPNAFTLAAHHCA